jgi:dolichyl-phosphate beta-glucosyltransferase
MIMPELSFIIPTYNRSQIVYKTISLIQDNYPESEIIVVDDGSSDNTEEILKSKQNSQIIYLKNSVNQGKGISLRRGFQAASGHYLIFTDDDLPYGIEGINLVVKALKEGRPIVMAQRDKFYDNFIKKVGRIVFEFIFKTFLGIKEKDTQAGLKGFESSFGKKLFSLSFINRFAIDLEIIFLCYQLKYPIYFVDVKLLDVVPSSLPLSDLSNIFIDTLKIKFHHYELP